MTKTESQEKYPAVSECIEPAFAHMIGVMGMRYMDAKENGDRIDLVEAGHALWAVLQLINLQTIFLSNATHASIAISNQMRKVSYIFEHDLGIDPILGKTKDGEKPNIIELRSNSYLEWSEMAKA